MAATVSMARLRCTREARANSSNTRPGRGNLTRRHSNPKYDVKHYKLTIVMDATHVPRLIDRLSAMNYHTVLSLHMRSVTPE